MPSSTKLLLASLFSCTLVMTGAVRAEDRPQQASVALIDKTWAVNLDIPGYRVLADGVKPDSRRYFLATNDTTAMHLSITLEAVSGQATEQGCLTHMQAIAQIAAAPFDAGPTRTELQDLSVFEYLFHETGGQRADHLHLFACTIRENVYTDIHLSQSLAKTGDEAQLRKVLESLTIVAAAKAGSLDHFRAGSAPYLQGQYKQAIPYYEQAVALERANPVLTKPLWRLLIHNLGVAYRRTGDLARAKTIIDYGLSQDPANPFFHYDLARTYAGMNERERTMQSLHDAFLHFRRSNERDPIPDPRQDVSFGRFMLDPVFRTLTESLMQPAI
ncbi:MAG: Cellulose synthase operon protein C [Nitrospira sp.]|nr:MAG: Cellulose synthase operon protein C [Nitrospira sp.]